MAYSFVTQKKTSTFAARMNTSGRFKIDLTDLPQEGASFQWHLDDSFFGALDEQEIEHGSLDATLRVNRKSGTYELHFRVQGDISIPCDRCLELMTQAIDTQYTLQARLGDHYEDDGEYITVPAEHAELDVAWNLYEIIALAIPIYHVHPEGECREEINQIFANAQTSEEKSTDTRWDALRSLLDKE